MSPFPWILGGFPWILGGLPWILGGFLRHWGCGLKGGSAHEQCQVGLPKKSEFSVVMLL